jgi:acetoacetate decarboxylase
MLKGFSVPLTPRGESALATLPPWHYSSEFWADQSAIAAVLPPGLAVDENSAPGQAMEMAQIMPDVAGD